MKKAINLQNAVEVYATMLRYQDLRNIASRRGDVEEVKKQDYNVAEISRNIDDFCAPLAAEIHAVEGKASARTLSPWDILKALHRVDKRFSFATKKDKDGLCVVIDVNAQEFPKAYKYTPMSTQFTAVYKSGTWRVSDIRREVCDKHGVYIMMPEPLKKAVLDDFESRLPW